MPGPVTDPQTIHNPAVGTIAPATWGDSVRDGIWSLANPARVRTDRNATQSIANNTITALTWNEEVYDSHGMHDNATNTHRLTVPTGWDGLWHVELSLEFAANATGFRGIHIKHSTSGGTETVIAKAYMPLTGAAVAAILHCATDYRAVATDYFYGEVWQTSGAALAVGQERWDFIQARWVSM